MESMEEKVHPKVAARTQGVYTPALDENGWAAVPNVINTDYKVIYTIPRPGEDIYMQLHLSGVVIIGLAPGHRVRKDKLTVTKVVAVVGEEQETSSGAAANTRKVSVSGKRKRGAPRVTLGVPICEIHCSDGSLWVVRSPVNGGKLVEFNERIFPQAEGALPQYDCLSCDKADFEGFLAIVLVSQNQVGQLLTLAGTPQFGTHKCLMYPNVYREALSNPDLYAQCITHPRTLPGRGYPRKAEDGEVDPSGVGESNDMSAGGVEAAGAHASAVSMTAEQTDD